MTLPEAIDMVNKALQTIKTFEEYIRSQHSSVPSALTGAFGFVSSKSIVSLEMTLWTLRRLHGIINNLGGYDDVSLLSMMTLSIENIHTTTQVVYLCRSQDNRKAFAHPIKNGGRWR